MVRQYQTPLVVHAGEYKHHEIRGVIASSEAIGHLDRMLAEIAKNLDKRSDLMMRFAAATIYPAVVFAALIIGAVTILVAVVPKIETLFAGSGIPMPLPTRILMGMII